MLPQSILDSPIFIVGKAMGIFLGSGLLAWLAVLVMRRFRTIIEKKYKSKRYSRVFRSLASSIVFILVLEGALLALMSLPYLIDFRPTLIKVSISAIIVLLTYGLARSVALLLDSVFKNRMDEVLTKFLRRTLVLFIIVLGFLSLLQYLRISITPFIAGLGIGGLAIALALQPTLGNFFAGAQIISDHIVKIGDYVELDNSTIRGYVVEIGWRSTRIRTPYNNLVTIPNSRLADSILTNFHSPNMEIGVIVNAGVSYSSNLQHVEDVALSVTREVIKDLDEAVKTFDPWFGFEEFGDSNINFWIWLQAKDRLASFRVRSELIKRLKARFDKEGITINYPVRQTFVNWPQTKPEITMPKNSK